MKKLIDCFQILLQPSVCFYFCEDPQKIVSLDVGLIRRWDNDVYSRLLLEVVGNLTEELVLPYGATGHLEGVLVKMSLSQRTRHLI